MSKKYIEILEKQDNFDFIDSYKKLNCQQLRRKDPRYNNKINNTLYINITEQPDVVIKRCFDNEWFLFNHTNKWFPQLFTNSTKRHISKIAKKFTNKFVNNLYNKVKCNIIDYMTGNVITDLIDTIIYSTITYYEKNSEFSFVDTIVDSISDRIYNELFNNKINCIITDIEQKEKIEHYEPTKTDSLNEIVNILEKEYNIFNGEIEKYFIDSIYKYIKDLVKYNVLHYIGVEILRTFKKSKEFDYINNDSKSYFNTSASAFEDQKDDLDEIMNMYSFKGTTKSIIRIKLSNFILESLELIKNDITRKDKCDYKEFESIISTTFDNRFESVSNLINFYDKLNSSINSYKKDSISNSEYIHTMFANIKLFSIKNIINIIKDCEELSKQYGNSKDSIYFINAIKKSFRCSTMKCVRIKLKDNEFDENIFKQGLVKDFEQSKSFMRYLKRIDIDESQKQNILNQFVTKVYDKIHLLTSHQSDPINSTIHLINTIEQLYSDVNNLVYRYRNTNVYDIARLYVANDKMDDIVLSKGFDFDKSENINKKRCYANSYFKDIYISPHIKLNTSYRSFIK